MAGMTTLLAGILCGYCGAVLPDDGTGRRYCGHTHKVKARVRRRQHEAAMSGCTSKAGYSTIGAAAASGNLNDRVRAVRSCLYCPCYHLTRKIRGRLVVLVRIS